MSMRKTAVSVVIATLVTCVLLPGTALAASPSADELGAGQIATLVDSAKEASAKGVSMYRVYNPNSGEHFYTANQQESKDLVKLGWVNEGIGWEAPATSGTPVYRLYNQYGGEHHYTMSEAERDELIGAGWKYEGIGWYSAEADVPRIGLYRDYNPNAFANNHNYTIDSNEHATIAEAGWVSEGGGWFALATEKSFKAGWVLDGDEWRYFRNSASVVADWVVASAPPPIPGTSVPAGLQRYWLASDGVLAISRLVDPDNANDAAAGYLAYARDAGEVVRGKWDNQEGRVYIADNDGRLPTETGWLVTDKYDGVWQRYFIDDDLHAAVTGLFTIFGSDYYGFGGEGYVAHNTRLEIDGAWMRADNDGVLSPDTVVTNLVLAAQGYSSPSNYLIMVDIDDPCTIVFEGSVGNWSVKYVMECCTGAPESPTVEGVFSVAMKGTSFGEDKGYSCYYWTQFYGDYLFHSRKYYPGTHELKDGRMSERISEGCVRLYDEDAIWIQDNVPAGTTVVTTT